MAYFIRMKVTEQNQVTRYMCLMLSFMQSAAPIFTSIFFGIATAQEPSLRMCIKGFVTINLVINLDN